MKGWQMTPQELMRKARHALFPREKMQAPKRQTMFCYSEGPMFYLGQQIVKAMQDAGFPAKISECYRPPERQLQVFVAGHSRARPWESPHQFYEAVDIIHPSLGWNVSEDYWRALAAAVSVVAERFGVELVHGHMWRFRDSAHIELADWRSVAEALEARWEAEGEERPPDPGELWERFCEVLPDVAKARGARR